MTNVTPVGTDPAASVLVLLARIEGKLDGIQLQLGDVVKRVDRHEVQLSALTLAAQQLTSDALSRERTVVATAEALALAKSTAEDTARAASAKDAQSWSPVTRIFAAVAAVAIVFNLYQSLVPV